MEQSTALRLTDRPVVITGPNETTFSARVSADIVDEVNTRWRLDSPITPGGDAIFYAPEGTLNVSNTYFEDAIQDNYQKNLQNSSNMLNQTMASDSSMSQESTTGQICLGLPPRITRLR